MPIIAARAGGIGFHELSPRERLSALLDDGECTELVGPFDRIGSPWLLQQGLVPQSDDGVVVVRGAVDGHAVVGIAIEGTFEGGSIGEVGGAKIATALELATEACRRGQPTAALLLLESGGVRLQEATLGLATIAAIQSAIIELREWAPVIAIIAGPVGCFGGMSLAATLCTYIIGTPHGRLSMNGPEVIEQEAGPDELDAGDRELIWQIAGCEARLRDGWIDALVQDDSLAVSSALREAMAHGPQTPVRSTQPLEHLRRLRTELKDSELCSERTGPASGRACVWLERLSAGVVRQSFETPSILTAEMNFPPTGEQALAIAIVPDAGSRLPRASAGELGLEQAWALAACIDQFIADEQKAGTRRPIIAIVDTPGQAYGRTEEARCISVGAASAVDAYVRARRAGHPVLTLVVGRAVSGAFLAHGLQSDHIFALANHGVTMCAMNAEAMARITRRTLAEAEAAAAATLPMSFAIWDAHRLGVIDTLIEGVDADDPSPEDLAEVKSRLNEALVSFGRGQVSRLSILDNPYRQSTNRVRQAMREQWTSGADMSTKARVVGCDDQMAKV